MTIIRSRRFTVRLLGILHHIAQDKTGASRSFKDQLDKQIRDISNFPYKYRPSIYFDDTNIRDMVFKGYTIIYEVDRQNDQIGIMDIFNRNKPVE